jgi:hypothetical protein
MDRMLGADSDVEKASTAGSSVKKRTRLPGQAVDVGEQEEDGDEGADDEMDDEDDDDADSMAEEELSMPSFVTKQERLTWRANNLMRHLIPDHIFIGKKCGDRTVKASRCRTSCNTSKMVDEVTMIDNRLLVMKLARKVAYRQLEMFNTFVKIVIAFKEFQKKWGFFIDYPERYRILLWTKCITDLALLENLEEFLKFLRLVPTDGMITEIGEEVAMFFEPIYPALWSLGRPEVNALDMQREKFMAKLAALMGEGALGWSKVVILVDADMIANLGPKVHPVITKSCSALDAMAKNKEDTPSIENFNELMNDGNSTVGHFLTKDPIYSLKANDYLSKIATSTSLQPSLDKLRTALQTQDKVWSDEIFTNAIAEFTRDGGKLRAALKRAKTEEPGKAYNEVEQEIFVKTGDALASVKDISSGTLTKDEDIENYKSSCDGVITFLTNALAALKNNKDVELVKTALRDARAYKEEGTKRGLMVTFVTIMATIRKTIPPGPTSEEEEDERPFGCEALPFIAETFRKQLAAIKGYKIDQVSEENKCAFILKKLVAGTLDLFSQEALMNAKDLADAVACVDVAQDLLALILEKPLGKVGEGVKNCLLPLTILRWGAKIYDSIIQIQTDYENPERKPIQLECLRKLKDDLARPTVAKYDKEDHDAFFQNFSELEEKGLAYLTSYVKGNLGNLQQKLEPAAKLLQAELQVSNYEVPGGVEFEVATIIIAAVVKQKRGEKFVIDCLKEAAGTVKGIVSAIRGVPKAWGEEFIGDINIEATVKEAEEMMIRAYGLFYTNSIREILMEEVDEENAMLIGAKLRREIAIMHSNDVKDKAVPKPVMELAEERMKIIDKANSWRPSKKPKIGETEVSEKANELVDSDMD